MLFSTECKVSGLFSYLMMLTARPVGPPAAATPQRGQAPPAAGPFPSRDHARVIAGQTREKAGTAPIPAIQNRTKYPQPHRPAVIAGQNWRYTPRMTRNEENSRPGAGTKRRKAPHPDGAAGPLTRMTRNPAARRAAGPRAHRDGSAGWQVRRQRQVGLRPNRARRDYRRLHG